jgi:23S rRNA (cytidine1920-2'-O)/16S rRNA (cytidine1409-2'-O)-methyltransferase
VAVDVGFGQLHERLREDGRVRNLERTNIRGLGVAAMGGPASITVADLSFISLRTVLPALFGLTEAGGDLVLLVKPQFEAGRQEASRGKGVIRDPAVWRRVLDEVRSAAIEVGASMMEAMVSPLTGAEGNVEFLVRLQAGRTAADVDLDAVVADAVTRHGV